MLPSGGFWILPFILLAQVLTEAKTQPYNGEHLQGPNYPGYNLNEPHQQPDPYSPGSGLQNNAPHSPPSNQHLKPNFSEDELIVEIGSDLEVPYPLYNQISGSFLDSKEILVLLPNNTIVKVPGFPDLLELSKSDPEDTKVLISSTSMIPAPIYMRIVLLQPEEVMVKLPDGQILPNAIYLERYGEKEETQDQGGQTYFSAVPEKDSFPFVVENEPARTSPVKQKIPELSYRTSGYHPVLPEKMPDPVESLKPVRFQDPISYIESSPVPHYPVNYYQEPIFHLTNCFDHWPHYVGHLPVTPCQAEFQRPLAEPKVLLPTGLHLMDASRCSICDPASQISKIRLFTV